MIVAALSLIAALLLGKAGYDEMIVLGIRGGLIQPLYVGITGILVSTLIGLAGVALWRRWPRARGFAIVAAVLSMVFHIYGALPPHRNVGVIGAVLGVAIGVVLLVAARRRPPAAPSALVGRSA